MKDMKKNTLMLILSRMIVLTTLLVAAVVIQFSTASFLPLAPFYGLILGWYVLSLVYLLLYHWNSHHRFQAYLQLIFDLLLITALVYFSGGISGNFYFLYIFAIIASSMVLSERAAYMASALSAILFGALADGMYFKLIPYFREDQFRELSLGFVLYTIFLAWAFFFIVAFLVNHLAMSLGRARQALIRADREIEIKERQAAAGRAAALVAHEIRNPLAAISGSVQVLKSELVFNAEQSRLMEIVLKESQRVSRSIEQFLSLATPSRTESIAFDLAEVLQETLTMLKMSGEFNGRTTVKGNFAASKVDFYGNPSQLKQVFWNIARNALQAMPEGGVLSIDFLREDKNRLQMRFADTGKGMTAEEQKHIFEPFYTKFEGGQGLGMSVVQKIVEDYKGKIRIISEPQVGTEILITLPLTPANHHPDH